MTAPTPDAVEKAWRAFEDAFETWSRSGYGSDWEPAVETARAEVIAAVRAECAAKVEGFADAYPTDVWPETPFSDAQAASVMRLMVPRILATLEAQP